MNSGNCWRLKFEFVSRIPVSAEVVNIKLSTSSQVILLPCTLMYGHARVGASKLHMSIYSSVPTLQSVSEFLTPFSVSFHFPRASIFRSPMS